MCISKADLNLDSNVVIFEGANGQGKSAIIEAIAICLSEHKRSDSMKEFVQKGYDHGKIILKTLLNNELITFDINLNYRHGTPLERNVLYKGKHYINSEVTDLINSLELTFYSDIILSMQNQDDIATMTPTQRSNLLQKLFQFDFESQLKAIDEKVKEYENLSKINYGKLDAIAKDIDLKKQKLLTTVKKEFPFSKEEYAVKQKNLNEFMMKLNSLNDGIQKVNELQNEKSKLIINDKELNIKLNLLNTKRSEAKSSKKELENFNFDKQINDLQLKLNEYDENAEQLNKQSNNYNETIEKLSGQEKELQSNKTLMTYKEKDIDKRLKLIDKGICPECGQSTHNLNKEKVIEEKDDVYTQIKKIDDNLNKLKLDISSNKKELEKVKSELSSNDKQKMQCQLEINSLQKNYETLKSKLMPIDKWNELENGIKLTTENLENNSHSIEEISKHIDEMSNKMKERDDMTKQYSSLYEDIQKYNEVDSFNTIVETQKKEYETDITTNEKELENINKQNVEYVKEIKSYNDARHILEKELPNYLVVKTCAKLEKEMNDFIQVVFPNFKIRLLQSKRGVEFFYTTNDNIDLNDIKLLINAKMASGYEKAVLSAAFKVALCKAYGLTFAAFDEIDAAASDDNSVKTFESLLQSETFNQMFFITHKEPTKKIIKSLADNIISYHVTEGRFIDDDLEA